jgi:O-antigen ligase
MGFVLTILYLVTAFLGPVTVFGPLAAFHIELILAALVLLVSLPKLSGSFIFRTPQSLALVGLAFAVFVSILATGWISGAFSAFLIFIPSALAYFLVCLHCNSKKRLQIVVLMLLFVCVFVIANGYSDLRQQTSAGDSVDPATMDRPYLIAQKDDAEQWFYRIKGQDFISDPNDFAQLIVCLIPLVFIFWQRKKMFKNLAFVILPVCVLLYGAFLTHSRGSVLAILAVTVLAGRRRIGTVPSLLLAVGLFAGASALNFTGGRDISVESGEGRFDLWGDGLGLLKSHPLFGVGFGGMGDYTGGHTAHNSLVVCAAELGLFGLYFWSLFLLPTGRDILVIASPDKVSEGEPIVVEQAPPWQVTERIETVDREEVCRLGRLMLLSFTGFLVAGWFLSRAFVMTLFLLGGMAEVFFEMALRQGMVSPRLPPARVLRFAGVLAISMLALMYIMLRITNLTH